jgi:hypothetical protein
MAEDFERQGSWSLVDLREGFLILVGLITLWPMSAIAWAFLFRGGGTLRLMGLRLVRFDGRKAARWQCAWRALVLWAPVCGLLILSVWLDVWRVCEGDFAAPHHWVYWLSWACWGLAVALFPIYAGLALLFPNRSVHDWLAGTYLVPR